uniref:Hybrid cis-AT polyketide synthase-nonribosomal peptide synthetase n=1 Tax=Microcystis aeruginosa NIES-87 TaxID=449440 RepID=A0A1L7NR40_MICAE|nr:hybrid cis-AT polyketide synthase - nonribosomal peptide synthetase [Microcystis aeruginosa NIES-87]
MSPKNRPVDQLLHDLEQAGISLAIEGELLRVRGPVKAISQDLRVELTARKQELMAILRMPASPAASRASLAVEAPVTHNQRRLWFLNKLENTSAVFRMMAAWELVGPLDIDAFNQAIASLTARHPILRSTIRERGEDVFLTPMDSPFEEVIPKRGSPNEIEQIIHEQAEASFDLANGPLFLVRLVEFSQTHRLLVIDIHHIISDRWSMGLLFRDLSAFMRAEVTGEDAALPVLPIQFSDFALSQHALLDQPTLEGRVRYWRETLTGGTAELALPLDRPRPRTRGMRGASLRFPLGQDANLSHLASHYRATAFMAYLAVYSALLVRWTGQDEVVVGCPIGGRERHETHDLVGFFVNTVALRLDLSDDPSFITLLERVKRVSLEAMTHQDVPFDRVVDALNPPRYLNRNPLFQAMFVLQNAPLSELAWPGIEARSLTVPAMAPEVDLNLALELSATPDTPFTGYLEYDPDLFEPSTVERFVQHFVSFCQAVSRAPEQSISQIVIADETRAVWQGPQRARPNQTLDEMLITRLAGNPNAIALMTTEGEAVSAGQLLHRARLLSDRLSWDTDVVQLVGIWLPRSPELVVSMLAIWLAGKAFVVLPVDAPLTYLEGLIESVGLTHVIVAPDFGSDSGRPLPTGVNPIVPILPAPTEVIISPVSVSNRSRQDLAYICFTSGSSGQPKGVEVSHAALVNHTLAIIEAFDLSHQDRVLQFAAPNFDVALEEIWPSLLAGGTVVIPSPAVTDSLHAFENEITASGVTVVNLPAPFWHAWVSKLDEETTSPPTNLRLVVTGSDRVYTSAVRRWMMLAPTVRLLSGYGPTETTITATIFDCGRDILPITASTVPLGLPLANVQVYLVDSQGNSVPVGVVGEIVIEGAGIAQGYVHTREKSGFRPRVPGGTLAFWTGDRGRCRPDGTLMFEGRDDEQVKVRGVRIEPAGVETLLASCPGIALAAVVARPDGASGTLLRAFYSGTAALADVRSWLSHNVPAALVPGLIERLDELPQTPSGKLDRRTLAARPIPLSPPPVRPLDDRHEQIIGEIFADVLQVTEIGPDSNFFELGGDSISSLKIVTRARRAGLLITVRTVFEHQTISAIAKAATPIYNDSEQSNGSGPLPLTPITAWFHEFITVDSHHFNQAVVLAVPKAVDAQALQTALTALVRCHDILGLTVSGTSEQLRHAIPETIPAPTLITLDLSTFPNEERLERRAQAFASAQSSLDPGQGRNLAAVLLADEGRLLVCIHHLCVDVLSWDVLLTDLETAYEEVSRGRQPRLSPSGTPFRMWAERMNELAAGPALDDISFWLKRLAHPADRLLPEAGDQPGCDGAGASVRRTLNPIDTKYIVRTAPVLFAVRSDEVILAALLKVLRQRNGNRLRVDLERNGRVSPFGDFDLSRTVGWFTTVIPLLLNQKHEDIAELLGDIGRAVTETPQDGLSYGLLRYLSSQTGQVLAALPPAEILVNFVGILPGWNEADFRPVDDDCGPTISPRSPRSHILELNAGVIEGHLRLELGYPGAAGCHEEAAALLDDIVAALSEIASVARATKIGVEKPQGIEEILPLTPLQTGIFFHSNRQEETYFNQLHLVLEGSLNTSAFRSAWCQLIKRHKLLRASFHTADDGTPLQFIHKHVDPTWVERDWTGFDRTHQSQRLAALMAADRATNFELHQAPLLRFHLLKTGDERHDLIWSSHHLLLDGWSVSVVMEELLALYREACGGMAAALGSAPDFSEYLTWLDTVDKQAAEHFWQQELSGIAEPTCLIGSGLAPNEQEPNAPAHHHLELPANDVQAIEELARTSGVTVGLVLQAAWGLLLSRYTGLDDVLFGLTVSGRPPDLAGVNRMVGMLINTLPIRIQIPDDTTVRSWLKTLATRGLDRDAYAMLPLPQAIAAAVMAEGKLPFDSLVLIQNYPRTTNLDVEGLRVSIAQVSESTSFAVTLVAEWAERPRLTIVRDRHLVAVAASNQLLRHLHQILQSLVRCADKPLDNISIYTPDELQHRLLLGLGERLDVGHSLAHETIAAWAELSPDMPAVISKEETLTYGQLVEQANTLAAHLITSAGIRPGSLIAMALPRSSAAIVAILAIWRVGAAVIPIDVGYPAERVHFMLLDCTPDLVLTNTVHRSSLPLDEGNAIFLIDTLSDAPLSVSRDEAWPRIELDTPAYVIYTSGSTGKPKGVLSSHRGLVSLIRSQRELFSLAPGDRVLQFASLSFDASIWETVMALASGAALYIPNREDALAGPELGTYLRTYRITAATLPPSLLAVLPEGNYPDLKLLVSAGEACPVALARRWKQGRRFFNAYGPSEATVCATVFEGSVEGTSLPIGRAIPNVSTHVVDSHLRPVPAGCEGELVIGGLGVALGYLGQPALTAKRFVKVPALDHPSETNKLFYRTGDRVRLDIDGTLTYLGRLDRQVKLDGFRIELGEIEATLLNYPGVAQALSTVRQDRRGEQRLFAWVLPKPGVTLIIEDLRASIRQTLPGYMVPSGLMLITGVPLTPNGKVDWSGLPATEIESSEQQTATAAEAAQQAGDKGDSKSAALSRCLKAIWSELLGRTVINPNDNFFDIGGSSLLLVQMQGLIHSRLGVSLSSSKLFRHPTLDSLVELLLPQEVTLTLEERSPTIEGGTAERIPTARAEPIAVVGAAGRFPGSPNLEAFWELLIEGREGISRFDKESLLQSGMPLDLINNPAWVPVGGVIDDAEAFDPTVFGIGARDALILDPQHRVFLECAWHALEHAGYAPKATDRSIGLFASSGQNTWLHDVLLPAGETITGSTGFHLLTANDKDFLASQAAYRLDLKGPVVTIQTACSSSLVAVSMAIDALRTGRCEMALAGGVSIRFPQNRGYLYEPEMILSPDGHCRAFSADANGTVPGSGVGVVVLKPLSQAKTDGDRILAVVRGIAVNNDGSNKMGYTAPGVAGQAQVIRAALEDAGLTADDVDYVEAHGTGTPLGDPVEVTALGRVYTGRREPLLLGSVKTNIGHADAAAGIAGFLKVVLALERGQLPASLHAQPLNPRIDYSVGPFEVVDRTRSWPERGRPLRGAISSFGIGGTNVHAILEASPCARPVPNKSLAAPVNVNQAVILSAQTAAVLHCQTERLITHLRAHPELPIADVAFTLQCGRTVLPHRRAVVANSSLEAALALEAVLLNSYQTPLNNKPIERSSMVALLLPGQGSQHLGMGQQLYEAGGVFRRELDTYSEILRPLIDFSIVELLFSGGEDKAKVLQTTQLAQPLVFALDVALARHWQGLGIQPVGFLGHSLGEYAAAHLAGVFSTEDALALVVERGRLLGELPPGVMLAVPRSEVEIHGWLSDDLALAAVNNSTNCVVSGSFDAIEAFEARLKEMGCISRRLHTSHAFHSPMMTAAAEPLAAAVARFSPKRPQGRFISNVTGTWITPEDAIDPNYWARHLLQTVRFADGLATLQNDGITLAIECGPGQTLTILAKGTDIAVQPSLAHAAEIPTGGSRITDAAANLWVEGASINWSALHPEPRRRVDVPLYPFERLPFKPKACLSPSQLSERSESAEQVLPGKRRCMDEWFYRPGWQPALPSPSEPLAGPVMILSDRGGIGEALANLLPYPAILVEQGAGYAALGDNRFTVRPAQDEDYYQLFKALPTLPLRFLHLWGLDDANADTLEEIGVHAVLSLVRSLGGISSSQALRLDLVTHGAAAITGTEVLRPELAAAIGAARVLPYEYPNLTVRAIDVEPESPRSMAAAILSEIMRKGEHVVIGLRGERRWTPTFWPLALPASSNGNSIRNGLGKIRPKAVVWITGGFGGVGSAVARDLAKEQGIQLVLTGRTALGENGADSPTRKDRLQLVREIEAMGAIVMTAALDLADERAVKALVNQVETRLGAITGVFHCAGVADLAGVVQMRSRSDTEHVLAPKVAGTRAIERALSQHSLDFLVLCSSLSSFLPIAKFGQVGYAAANEYMDLAAVAIARRTGWRTVTINWDDWVEAGMTVEAYQSWSIPAPTADEGLTAAEGVTVLRRILTSDQTRVAVSVRPLESLVAGSDHLFSTKRFSQLLQCHNRPTEGIVSTVSGSDDVSQDTVTRLLLEAFRRILDDPTTVVDSNFFERGGHSLLAMNLLNFIRETFSVGIALLDLFEHPTPPTLADIIKERQTDRE